ncbi:MAG: beta-galactosidase [Anaerolineae bacterium]|nr:beta-galactosidase [Anaerolineae bacterium]
MNTQTLSHPPKHRARRQVSVFIVVWMGLTLLVGACAFVAIYFASGDPRLAAMVAAAPSATPVPATATLLPTLPSAQGGPPIVTQAPTQEAVSEPPTAAPTLLPVQDKSFGYGIQVQENYDLQDYWYEMVSSKLGLKWVKQQIRWEVLQPEQDKIDFSVLDLVVPAASKHGIKLMLSVVTAPEWARPAGADLSKHGPPADFQDYADFIVAILERYPGQVHAVEVWNEQNIDREWSDPQGLSAARYVELLGVAERAIHAVDPGVIVISGALSPTGWNDETARDDFVYFDQLIDAGLLSYADCVGAHHNGYNIPPDAVWDDPSTMGPQAQYFTGPWTNLNHSWSFRSTLEYYYSAIVNAGGAQKLCITEFGWPTVEDMDDFPQGFEFTRDNTLEEQAGWIVQAFQWLADWDGAWIAFLWNLNYGPQSGDPTNDNAPYSVLDLQGMPRPAFDALAQMPKD